MIFVALLGLADIRVDVTKELNRISPALTGSCIEDVNHEIYGGLYAQRIFGESFEEPAANSSPVGWKTYGGQWSPDGDGVHVSGGPGFQLVRNMDDLTDGEVEGDITFANDFGTIAGFQVRVSSVGIGADTFDGYEISLDIRRNQILLGKHVHNFQSLKTVSKQILPAIKHHLKVNFTGPRLRVYVDRESKPSIDYIDVVDPLLKGKVSLRTWHSDVTYRGIKINGQVAKTSFATPGVSERWQPLRNSMTAGEFALTNDAYNGVQAQTIIHGKGGGNFGIVNRGLNRWGISVRAGHAMLGSVYLKGSKIPVTVALQSLDGSKTYASQVLAPGATWAKHDFKLTPNASDGDARFVVFVDQPGSITVDQVSLMDADEDRYQGLPVRRDVVEAMLESGINFLRYGGSMVNVPGYRWKNMIGSRDKRPPYVGNWYPASTNGFGIFDFLNLCERANIGSAVAISADETPQDAADFADYLAGNANTHWGRQRAQDGHPEQYKIDYLEIGNEEAIGNITPESLVRYAGKFRRLAKSIHAKAPKIKLVCAAWWMPDLPATEQVFRMIDGECSAWDIHVGGDNPKSGDEVMSTIQGVKDRFLKWNPKTLMKAVIFEENGGLHNMQRALGHATNVNAVRRFGDFVLVDCAANCLQPYQQNDNGWDQGQIFLDPVRSWLMPPAFANQMLRDAYQPIRIQVEGPKELDIVAAKSEDGKTVVLTVVNTGSQPVGSSLRLGDARVGQGTVTTLTGPSEGQSQDVHFLIPPDRAPFHMDTMIETFAPHSISRIELKLN